MKKLDFTRFITKEVLTNDDKKSLGHIDGFDNIYIVVKKEPFNPQYYRIPWEKVEWLPKWEDITQYN